MTEDEHSSKDPGVNAEQWREQLLADYSHGVVHLAVLQHMEKPPRYQLLFGFAELLPNEVPPEEMPGPFSLELSRRPSIAERRNRGPIGLGRSGSQGTIRRPFASSGALWGPPPKGS
jgi:hypothetical protein